MAERITLSELEAALAYYYGSETWWRNPLFPKFTYTDGVKACAEKVGAYWLIDLIMSHQHFKQLKAAPFQVWTITVADNAQAVIECREDTNEPVIAKQEVEYTNFPTGVFKPPQF